MAGDQTHGFDLVVEFAERAYQELLSVLFDTDGFLFGTILGALGIDLDPGEGFSVTIAFDRPAGLPASAADVIDVGILLGEAGALGSMRMVASVDVAAVGDTDLVRINLEDKLWLTEIDVLGHTIPGLNGLFARLLRNSVKAIPLMPVPVDRTTASNTKMKAAHVRVIDDTSAEDRDASAILITFGGGSAGNRNAFTRSFVSPGGRGAIAVGFPWMCRVISPMIDTSLELGGAFSNCRLTRTVRIDADEEIDLTELSITPAADFLQVRARVRQSGFCYTATGTVGAQIRIEVVDGHLIVQAFVDDPDVDVDIPWYCWVAGAVIGAFLGGLLAGVIGAIIGAVLIPVITYIAQEVIEGTVNSVAERIADALNSIAPSVDIPAVGFRLLFSDASIDDVQIDCRVDPIDSAPIRATGTLVVPTGAAVDLDSGQVGSRDLPGADLAVRGGMLDRVTEAVCGARLARTGLYEFSGLVRASVYGYAYAAPNPIPLSDMARLDPFGFLFGNPFNETKRIYGVRTNEGRWAAVQAVEVTTNTIRLRFITWEKAMASVKITGDFACPLFTFGSIGELVKPGTSRFVGSRLLPTPIGVVVDSTPTGSPNPCLTLGQAVRDMAMPGIHADKADPVKDAVLAAPPAERRIGTWRNRLVDANRPVGRFDAVTDGMGLGQIARWQLDGVGLGGTDGTVDLGGGASAGYQLTAKSVTLTINSDRALEMLLSVTVVDDAGNAASSKRCLRYEPDCKQDVRVIPMWTEYQGSWLSQFGIAEVPTKSGASSAPR